MYEKSESTTTQTVGVPEPLEDSAPAAAEFRMDVLLIGVIVVAAIVVSNIWLRKRADSQ